MSCGVGDSYPDNSIVWGVPVGSFHKQCASEGSCKSSEASPELDWKVRRLEARTVMMGISWCSHLTREAARQLTSFGTVIFALDFPKLETLLLTISVVAHFCKAPYAGCLGQRPLEDLHWKVNDSHPAIDIGWGVCTPMPHILSGVCVPPRHRYWVECVYPHTIDTGWGVCTPTPWDNMEYVEQSVLVTELTATHAF